MAVAIGFILKAKGMSGNSDQMMTYAGAGLMLIGAIAWSIHLFKRAKHPGMFIRKELSKLPFNVYTIATILGLIIIGITLFNGDVSAGIAWLTIIFNAIFLVLYFIYRDIPPFVYYILTFIIGFMHLS